MYLPRENSLPDNCIRNIVEVTNPGGTISWTIRGDQQVNPFFLLISAELKIATTLF
jgi:hypothetical protein